MKHFLLSFFISIFVVSADAQIHKEVVEYKDGETALEGYLAYDDAIQGKRPGILVIHEWKGVENYVKHRADQLAEIGYVAFAPDMFGKGIRPQTHEEAGKILGIYFSDRSLMRKRAQAGLDILIKNPLTDIAQVAAIGYCFGGTAVLELARMGAPLLGVVSFHGVLAFSHPEDAKNIKCKVLILHGANDFSMKSGQIAAFQDELRKANVDWQMIYYGGAVHSFTVPEAGNNPSSGFAYDEKADQRSWQAMKNFFNEIFGK